MGSEIERKFLVKDISIIRGITGHVLCQGYVASDGAEVRIRIAGENATLTLKSEKKEMIRTEFEYSIPLDDAKNMLTSFCQHALVEKVRYVLVQNNLQWEVDVFKGDNDGLVVAELETDKAIEQLELPDWVGDEVTGIEKYYNANLAKLPYTKWE